jgi:succinate-acetate transporter protein
LYLLTNHTFFLLVWGDATGNESIKHLAGYEGIICGLSAIYTGIRAQYVLNDSLRQDSDGGVYKSDA